MSRLDDALREAMRREDPGPDFTARVLARAAADPPKRKWWESITAPLRPGVMRWAAAGTLAGVLMVAGAVVEHQRELRVRAEGEAAKERLMLALRIAGGKLNLAREKVEQLNTAAVRN